MRAKRELIRVVRSPGGALTVDLRGKASGRGAYLCPDEACLERGIALGALATALASAIDADTARRLKAELSEGMATRMAGR